jgi:hypothetical protein
MQPTQLNPSRLLDVICLGRLGADLCAPQIGARLKDATSFAKYKAERHQEGRTMTYARSPGGATTYMRQGVLLTRKGVGQDRQTIEFAIDGASVFRPDLLTPMVRVRTISEARHGAGTPQDQLRLGVSVQGIVVWQLLDPALPLPAEGSVEDLLKSLLASCLNAE